MIFYRKCCIIRKRSLEVIRLLQFLGRGSAFSDSQNCAFFLDHQNLVLLDCGMTAFHSLRHTPMLHQITEITVLVTHTHSDHVSGIPMLIHYAYFVLHIPVTVVVPNEAVRKEMLFLIDCMDGCAPDAYSLLTCTEFSADWLMAAIPTVHAPRLQGKCFGYHLCIDGQNVVYTGDTATLEPFLPLLREGSYLYTEAAQYQSRVHLYIKHILPLLKKLRAEGVHIYLMHLDDEFAMTQIIQNTGLLLAPLYKENLIMDHTAMLSSIYDISDKLYKEMCSKASGDHSTLFLYLTELGKVLTASDRASFWKWDKNSRTLWTMAATGTMPIYIPDDTGLVGKALREERIVISNDPYHDPDFNSDVDKSTGYVTKSILVLPVADINGNFIGAYQIINKLEGEFNEEDGKKLSLAALICGIALESECFLEASQHDRLTKLKNRMGFYSDYTKKIQKQLDNGVPVSMFLCDIDHFKHINDTYGHNAGDDALAFISGLLSENCRATDYAYRWGGEEFIIIMPNTQLSECAERAEAIRKRIMTSSCCADGNDVMLTVSFGCIQLSREESVENNISRADEYLYYAKEHGRNRVVWHL